jgi:hypothetical protein
VRAATFSAACLAVRDGTVGCNEIGYRVALYAHAHPQLQIQQAPDAIPVIANARPMLGKKVLYKLSAEQSPFESSRSAEQAL